MAEEEEEDVAMEVVALVEEEAVEPTTQAQSTNSTRDTLSCFCCLKPA